MIRRPIESGSDPSQISLRIVCSKLAHQFSGVRVVWIGHSHNLSYEKFPILAL